MLRSDVVEETVQPTQPAPSTTGVELDDIEQEWRDRFEGLKANGYLLRPRFRPGWQPSWLQTEVSRFLSEDFFRAQGT